VISSCEIPFIIVQKDTKHVDIKDIVVPINLSKESLQIVSPASDIARIFDSTLHIIGEKYADEGLSAQTKNRVLLIRNKCDETHTKCDVNLLPLGGSFSKKIVNYVKEKNINMIAVSYFSESLLPQFDGFAQALITNELNLPCMIISAKQGGNVYF
jgi:K+-sensing histidine kinase KdpD